MNVALFCLIYDRKWSFLLHSFFVSFHLSSGKCTFMWSMLMMFGLTRSHWKRTKREMNTFCVIVRGMNSRFAWIILAIEETFSFFSFIYYDENGNYHHQSNEHMHSHRHFLSEISQETTEWKKCQSSLFSFTSFVAQRRVNRLFLP